jgi:RNA polymerase sigma-70 factor (ECF subfamily)
LVNDIKNGNVQVFEQAYVLHREKLFAYFLKKTRCDEDAKDLLQITFSKLWQYRKSLSPEYLLEQHLFNIARTVFIDYLRKENKQQKIKASVKLKEHVNLSPEYIQEFDVQARLQAMLSNMPLLRKQVFQLHKIEGYSYKEIAEMLSISLKSVDNNIAKALKYLRTGTWLFLIFVANILH